MGVKRLLTAGAAAAAICFSCSGAFAADLLTNGSFETGNFSGWTVTGGATGVQGSGFSGYAPEDGHYFVGLGAVGCCGTISQSVSDTAGQRLQLSYYYNSNGSHPAYFEADWNGSLISGSALTDPGATGGYVHYLFDVVGTGSDTLTFQERNDPSYDALDNVSLNVAGVPEPGVWAMLLLGMFGMGAAMRLHRKDQLGAVALG